jgi:hypothetical protein
MGTASTPAKVCSPIQPSSRLASVMPIWVAEKNGVGLALACWTSRAARWPATASWSIRVARAATSENSVATKNPFMRMRRTTTKKPVV